MSLTVEDVVAEDDPVALHGTMRGTHSGTFAGIPPTGTKVTVGLANVIRIKNGRFAEQWGGRDMADLMRQLDVTQLAD